MRLKLPTLLLCLCSVSLSYAQSIPLSEEKAQSVAESFLSKHRTTRHTLGMSKRVRNSRLSIAQRDSDYYAFNIGKNDGYVLVSNAAELGNDLSVFGYSASGSFDKGSMSNAERFVFENALAGAKAMAHNPQLRAQMVAQEEKRKNVSPLILTKWNQGFPYNLRTPHNDVTGCVATAMAQVLYYWQWPTTPVKAFPAYYNPDRKEQVPAYPEYGEITLDWGNMQHTYTGERRTPTPADTAVASLMRLCGQSVLMAYQAGGSAATLDCTRALSLFGYKGEMRYIEADNYPITIWTDIMYNELAHNRPVLYSGQHPSVGDHEFVLHGYQDGLFVFNFGWGFDASYRIYDARGFSAYQTANVHVQPNTLATTDVAKGNLSCSRLSLHGGQRSYTRQNANEAFLSVVIRQDLFAVHAYQRTKYRYGVLAIKKNTDGTLQAPDFTQVSVLSNADLTLGFADAARNQPADAQGYSLSLEPGEYRLVPVSTIVETVNGQEQIKGWMLSDYAEINYFDITVTETTLTLQENAPDLTVTLTPQNGSLKARRLETVSLRANNSGTEYNGNIYCFFNGKLFQTFENKTIAKGAPFEGSFSVVAFEGGKDTIKIATDKQGKDLIHEQELTFEAVAPAVKVDTLIIKDMVKNTIGGDLNLSLTLSKLQEATSISNLKFYIHTSYFPTSGKMYTRMRYPSFSNQKYTGTDKIEKKGFTTGSAYYLWIAYTDNTNNEVFIYQQPEPITVLDEALITLDENDTQNTNTLWTKHMVSSATGTLTNATIGRSLKPNRWNTLILPFDVEEEQMKTIFGEGYVLQRLASVDSTSDTYLLNYVSEKNLSKGVSYLFKFDGNKDIVNPTFYKVKVDPTPKQENLNGIYFVGTYKPIPVPERDSIPCLYLSADGTRMIYARSGSTIKGFRCFWKVSTQKATANVAKFAINLEGEGTVTGLISVHDDPTEVNSTVSVYDLQGKQVDRSTNGVIIVNGKKVLK